MSHPSKIILNANERMIQKYPTSAPENHKLRKLNKFVDPCTLT